MLLGLAVECSVGCATRGPKPASPPAPARLPAPGKQIHPLARAVDPSWQRPKTNPLIKLEAGNPKYKQKEYEKKYLDNYLRDYFIVAGCSAGASVGNSHFILDGYSAGALAKSEVFRRPDDPPDYFPYNWMHAFELWVFYGRIESMWVRGHVLTVRVRKTQAGVESVWVRYRDVSAKYDPTTGTADKRYWVEFVSTEGRLLHRERLLHPSKNATPVADSTRTPTGQADAKQAGARSPRRQIHPLVRQVDATWQRPRTNPVIKLGELNSKFKQKEYLDLYLQDYFLVNGCSASALPACSHPGFKAERSEVLRRPDDPPEAFPYNPRNAFELDVFCGRIESIWLRGDVLTVRVRKTKAGAEKVWVRYRDVTAEYDPDTGTAERRYWVEFRSTEGALLHRALLLTLFGNAAPVGGSPRTPMKQPDQKRTGKRSP